MTAKFKEMLKVRVASAGFVALALAVFMPFGLEASDWMSYAHFLAIFVLGVVVCLLSEAIVEKVFGLAMTDREGVNYIIRRNLIFQLINTPLIAVMICLYRHFVLSNAVESNQLSWGNYFETLLIVTFCSFAIGLYWRFKFRSKFLAAELEETHRINEQLSRLHKHSEGAMEMAEGVASNVDRENTPAVVTLKGSTNESVVFAVPNLLYVESEGNYAKVCWLKEGKKRMETLRATLSQVEDALKGQSMVFRCHRAYLVNLHNVEQINSKSGVMWLRLKQCEETVPVSRSHKADIKATLRAMVDNLR